MLLSTAAALAATAVSLAPTYVGRTDEGRRIVVQTNGSGVELVHAGVDDYDCLQFGQIGPIRVHERPAKAGVNRSTGKASFSIGPSAQRLSFNGTFTSTKLTGTIRVRGSIATGQSCSSRTLKFSARSRD
jgi:hypothetical protein